MDVVQQFAVITARRRELAAAYAVADTAAESQWLLQEADELDAAEAALKEQHSNALTPADASRASAHYLHGGY